MSGVKIKLMKLNIWILETRPRFHLLSIELILLGTCIAWYDGNLNIAYAVLAAVGLLLANISCNVLNDYSDYKQGVDLQTKRTPFSGGSGVLSSGLLRPRQVLWLGIICFIMALPVGIYFVIIKGWLLIPILLIGAISVLFYTPFILRYKWPEWSPALGMGVLPVLGAYFIQTGAYTLPVVVASIPSGILAHNLLLINGFPDTEADVIGNRKTLPITMGKR
ncbi:prenyltransferase, partial [Chloroflexota bacterium]